MFLQCYLKQMYAITTNVNVNALVHSKPLCFFDNI